MRHFLRDVLAAWLAAVLAAVAVHFMNLYSSCPGRRWLSYRGEELGLNKSGGRAPHGAVSVSALAALLAF